MKLEELTDYLQIVISKEEIQSLNVSQTLTTLNKLIETKETIKAFEQRVDISVDGYNNDKRALYEIPEVRKYIQKLDAEFPFWFYFLNNLSSSLKLIALCCINCEVKNNKVHYDTTSMQTFLMSHFDNMNRICDYIGMTEEENKELSDLVLGSIF